MFKESAFYERVHCRFCRTLVKKVVKSENIVAVAAMATAACKQAGRKM